MFQNRIENSQRIPHRFWENQQSESVLRGFVLSKSPLPLPPLQFLCGGGSGGVVIITTMNLPIYFYLLLLSLVNSSGSGGSSSDIRFDSK